MTIKIEDIVLWIVILFIIGIGVYLLIKTNSPIEVDALISLTLFVAASELLIWRSLFKMDKKVACGFIKMKSDMSKMENKMILKLNNIENKLVSR